METSCETGEGRNRSGPVGVCGVEAQVEIPPGNAEDPYAGNISLSLRRETLRVACCCKSLH